MVDEKSSYGFFLTAYADVHSCQMFIFASCNTVKQSFQITGTIKLISTSPVTATANVHMDHFIFVSQHEVSVQHFDEVIY